MPLSILLGIRSRGPNPCEAVTAHVNRQMPKIGMMIIFARKIQRNAGILRNRNGRDASQKIEKLRSSAAVIPALAGRASACHLVKDGHMASIMA